MITTKKRNDNPLNVFEDVFGTLFNDSVGALAKAAQTGSWTPAVDIVESTDAYTLTADLPGLTKGDVHLTVEDGVLTLSGERKGERSESNEFAQQHQPMQRWGDWWHERAWACLLYKSPSPRDGLLYRMPTSA